MEDSDTYRREKKQSGQQVELLPGTPEKDYFDLKSVVKTRDGSSL